MLLYLLSRFLCSDAKKSHTDPTKQHLAKEKADNATTAYTDLNAELVQDIPNLIEDRMEFFTPLFATLVDGQVMYLEKSAEAFRSILPYFEQVNRKAYQSHPCPITSPEQSSYKTPAYGEAGYGGGGGGGGLGDGISEIAFCFQLIITTVIKHNMNIVLFRKLLNLMCRWNGKRLSRRRSGFLVQQ